MACKVANDFGGPKLNRPDRDRTIHMHVYVQCQQDCVLATAYALNSDDVLFSSHFRHFYVSVVVVSHGLNLICEGPTINIVWRFGLYRHTNMLCFLLSYCLWIDRFYFATLQSTFPLHETSSVKNDI